MTSRTDPDYLPLITKRDWEKHKQHAVRLCFAGTVVSAGLLIGSALEIQCGGEDARIRHKCAGPLVGAIFGGIAFLLTIIHALDVYFDRDGPDDGDEVYTDLVCKVYCTAINRPSCGHRYNDAPLTTAFARTALLIKASLNCMRTMDAYPDGR